MSFRAVRCSRCGEVVAAASGLLSRLRWCPTNCTHVEVGVAGDALTVKELRKLAESEVER